MTAAAKLSGILVLLLTVQCRSQKRLALKEYLPTQLRLLETIAERLDSIDSALQKVQAAVEVNENETLEEQPAVERRKELDSEKIQSTNALPPIWFPFDTDVPSARDYTPERQGNIPVVKEMLLWSQRKRQLDYDQPWINGTNPDDDQVMTD